MHRKKCKIIYLHWPEGFWRSNSIFLVILKGLYFIFIHNFSKLIGYKWVWSVHNVNPHLNVKSQFFEILMRIYLINNLDYLIGTSKNTRDYLSFYSNKFEKKYSLCYHIDNSIPLKNVVSKKIQNIFSNKNIKYLLILSTLDRPNKNVSDFIQSWAKVNSKIFKLIVFKNNAVSFKSPNLIEINNLSLKDEEVQYLFKNVNFLVLPYQSINTSGQYFLSIKYNLPVIAPNLPFFLYHGSNKNIIYYDYDEPIINHIEKIHKNIKNFKYTNSKKLNQKYYDENEYKKITEILNDL